jgi:MFS family permease
LISVEAGAMRRMQAPIRECSGRDSVISSGRRDTPEPLSDPVFDQPRELELTAELPRRALELLRRADFRRLYLAVSASELGDSLHYIALMWFALDAGGPLGVVAVRLADSIPAIVFGLHGGLAADRWSRKRLMVSADLVRGVVLVPVGIAALTGSLPLWGLVVAAFILEAATSYFAPAYGATVPTLVDRENVQQANALVQATAQALSIGGWAVAAALLAFIPVSVFFAVNAVTFFVSAALIGGIRHGREHDEHDEHAEPPRLREGFAALRPRPLLTAGVLALGVAVTITAGTWIGGVPTLIRDTLHHGAGGFSIVMAGYAAGSILSGIVLSRISIRRKARASLIAWVMYLPGYGLIALATSLPLAIAGAFFAGLGQSTSVVLLNSAAQEEVPDHLLGRVLGLISFTHRGAHAIGLLLVSPLFAFVAARAVFGAAAIVVPLVGLTALVLATRYSPSRRSSRTCD